MESMLNIYKRIDQNDLEMVTIQYKAIFER